MVAWEKYNLNKEAMFNCYVGGDKICNILYRIKTMKILDYILRDPHPQPQQIIVMGGANDVERGNTAEMVNGLCQILDLVHERFPGAFIDVCGVYPRRSEKIPEHKVIKHILSRNKTSPNSDQAWYIL